VLTKQQIDLARHWFEYWGTQQTDGLSSADKIALEALMTYERVVDRLGRFEADTESRRKLKLPYKELAQRDQELRAAMEGK
jgi:hypothetical protein